MPILELKDICKDYQQGREPVRVLKNINLTVEKGDYIAIMGPSGSGKTTLMNIIGCLDVPTSGSYILEGRDLKDLSDDDLAEVRDKHIGFVFQSFHLLPKMEAVDNVALPLRIAGFPEDCTGWDGRGISITADSLWACCSAARSSLCRSRTSIAARAGLERVRNS